MGQILTIWKKELVDNLRDRRTVVTSLLLPIVLMPAILIGSFKLQEAQIKSASEKIAVVGIEPQDAAPTLTSFLQSQPLLSVHSFTGDAAAAIDDGTVNIVVTVPQDFEAKLAAHEAVTVDVKEKSSDYNSTVAINKVMSAIAQFNQNAATAVLAQAGLTPSALQTIVPNTVDVATEQERGGFFTGLLLPMFIVIFALIGGMYIAIDVSAGEKERKTLEALLFTPVRRQSIVTGKFLAVATMSITTIVLSLGSMVVAFKVSPPDFGEGAVAITLSAGTLGIMLLLGVVMAVMFSGLLLSVAIFAKNYKEAQNYISPFYLLAVLPVSIVNSIPGFVPSLPYFFIPAVNAVFVMKEVLLGTYDWLHIAVTLASLCAAAVIAVVVAGRIYSQESILFRD